MTDERPPNKRQLQAAATRERMLNAASDVFESKGYRATTVGAITKLADTAHGTFYLYFRNKDDAFGQVMARVVEELRTAQRAGLADDRYDALEGVLRGFLGVFTAHPGLWRALLEGMLSSPQVERMWLATRDEFIKSIAHWLEREEATGQVRALDTDMAAIALGSMAEWYAFTYLVIGGHQSGEGGIDRAVRTLTDLWYHALYGETDHDRQPDRVPLG